NLIAVGNPLPGLRIGVGRLHLPRPTTPSMDNFGSNLLHVITNTVVWKEGLLPGLRLAFGPAWPLLVLILTGTVVVGLLTLRGRDLVLPIAAACAAAAFVITPGTVWAPQLVHNPGVPVLIENLFGFNLRYLLPAVAIGLTVAPL